MFWNRKPQQVTYNITVKAKDEEDSVEFGRKVVAAIKRHEEVHGKGWHT